MRLLTTLCLIAFSLSLQAQSRFTKTLTGFEAKSMKPCADGGAIIVGVTHSGSLGKEDGVILKLDSLGRIAWRTTAGLTGNDGLMDVVETKRGTYIAVGYTDDNPNTSYCCGQDVLLYEFSADGKLIKEVISALSSDVGSLNDYYEKAISLEEIDNGSYLMGVRHISYRTGWRTYPYDLTMVMEVDSNLKYVRKTQAEMGDLEQVIETHDGDVLWLTGSSGNYRKRNTGIVLTKYGYSGGQRWSYRYTYGTVSAVYGKRVKEISGKALIVTGTTSNNSLFVSKLDSNADPKWAYHFDDTWVDSNHTGYQVIEDAAKNLYVACSVDSSMAVIKLDKTGKLQKTVRFKGMHGYGFRLFADAQGAIWLLGNSEEKNYVAKMNSQLQAGCVDTSVTIKANNMLFYRNSNFVYRRKRINEYPQDYHHLADYHTELGKDSFGCRQYLCGANARFSLQSKASYTFDTVKLDLSQLKGSSYSWYINDTLLSSTKQLNWIPDRAGDYTVSCKALAQGCQDSFGLALTVGPSTRQNQLRRLLSGFEATAMRPCSDGGYIVSGLENNGSNGGQDGIILKLDSLGKPAWKETITSSGSDALYDVMEHPSGGYVAVGSAGKVMLIVRVDSAGNVLNRIIRSVSRQYVPQSQRSGKLYSIEPRSAGGFIISGTAWDRYNTQSAVKNCWIAEFDTTLKEIKAYEIYSSDQWLWGAKELANGQRLRIGSASGATRWKGTFKEADEGLWLSWHDSSNYNSTKYFRYQGASQRPRLRYPRALIEAKNKDLIISGTSFNDKHILMRLNSEGTMIWAYEYEHTGGVEGIGKYGLYESAAGNIITTGRADSTGSLIMEVDADGKLITAKRLADANTIGVSLIPLPGGAFASLSTNGQDSNYFMLLNRELSNGCNDQAIKPTLTYFPSPNSTYQAYRSPRKPGYNTTNAFPTAYSTTVKKDSVACLSLACGTNPRFRLNSQALCTGDTVKVNNKSKGGSFSWYLDNKLLTQARDTSLVFTQAGSHTLKLVADSGTCKDSFEQSFSYYAVPAAPSVVDQKHCGKQASYDLKAKGQNIRWYTDSLLTKEAYQGDSVSITLADTGAYDYFATQRVNGCISSASKLNIGVYGSPAAPKGLIDSSCSASKPSHLVIKGSNIQWYSNSNGTGLLVANDSLSLASYKPGTYPLYHSQTINGCESPVGSSTYKIKASPARATGLSSPSVCQGSQIPNLSAQGSNLSWYADRALSNRLATGTSFATGRTAVGRYTYYVAADANGCFSEVDSATLRIKEVPKLPVVADRQFCQRDGSFYLTSNSNLTQWELKGSKLGSGDTLSRPLSLGVQTIRFYAELEGCQSKVDSAKLEIKPNPSRPVVANDSICQGDASPYFISGSPLSKWYSGTQLLHQGDSFKSSQSKVGLYTFKVYNERRGCRSDTSQLSLKIKTRPSLALASDVSYCEKDQPKSLSTGSTFSVWYNMTGSRLSSGASYSPAPSQPGTYTYQQRSELLGCYSAFDTVTITVLANPVVPVVSDDSICAGQQAPYFTSGSQGTQWLYKGNTIHRGDSFLSKETAPGTYAYRAYNEQNGCKSSEISFSYLIKTTPAGVLVADVSYCQTEPAKALQSGSSLTVWYGLDGTYAGSGSSFSPNPSVPGIYSYQARNELKGCYSAFDTAMLELKATPVTPIVSNDSICAGQVAPYFLSGSKYTRWVYQSNVLHQGDSFRSKQQGVGSYAYKVYNEERGCRSAETSFSYLIKKTPTAQPVADVTYCESDQPQALNSGSANTIWYQLAGASLAQGASFNPQLNQAGVYFYPYRDEEKGCYSPYDTAQIRVRQTPAKPLVSSDSICDGESAPYFVSGSANSVWTYQQNVVHHGDSFLSSITALGSHAYEVYNELEGCKSPALGFVFLVKATPTKPSALALNECQGSTGSALSSGSGLTEWFFSGSRLAQGERYVPVQAKPGIYRYDIRNNLAGCFSDWDSVSYTLAAKPIAPYLIDEEICEGEQNPSFDSENSSTQWLDSTHRLLSQGSLFTSKETKPGAYPYKAFNEQGNCQSDTVKVLLSIYALPAPPVITDEDGRLRSSYSSGNQWFDEDGPIAGGTGEYLEPDASGKYYVVHSNSNGCNSRSNDYTYQRVGVAEHDALALQVYPNPVVNQFKVELGQPYERAQFEILDGAGRRVMMGQLSSSLSAINVEGLEDGVYMLRLTLNSDIYQRKLIIRRGR